MIGTKFCKPLEADTLFRTVMRTVTREVERQEPVTVEREVTRTVQEPVYTTIKAEDGTPHQIIVGYTPKEVTETVQGIEYQTVIETVTEEVPEQEECDNPAPNTMTRYSIAALWCNANRAVIEDKGEYYEVVAIPEPTKEEQIEAAYQALDAAVEARLNAFAATRKYSSINSACSYATSTDAQFRLEGEYCVQARDLTYRTCYDLLAEYMPAVQAGTRAIPTWEEIEPLLPELKWPDEA